MLIAVYNGPSNGLHTFFHTGYGMTGRKLFGGAGSARVDSHIQRYSVLSAIVLCTLISGLLADSLLKVWRIDPGEPIASGWGWLLGNSVQTFRTETAALLLGVLLLGFALGGGWFLLSAGFRWLRRQLSALR